MLNELEDLNMNLVRSIATQQKDHSAVNLKCALTFNTLNYLITISDK